MVILSWSLYQNAGSSPQFRQACCDMIALLRNKLRDGINNLNAQGSTKWKISALFPSTEATNSSVHMTYGLLYLIGRLAERYMAGGGSSREPQIAQLTDVLVWACQKSKFGEIKFKAYEILFSILAPIPSATTAVTLMKHQRMTEVEGESHLDCGRRKEEWTAHVECILERKRLIDNSLAKLDLEQIRRAKDEYELLAARTPLTPPTKSQDMIREHSHDSMQSMGMVRAGVRPDYQLEVAVGTPDLLSPLSPATSYADSDEYVWQQNPPPFPLDRMATSEPAKAKLRGTPVCAQMSNTGHSVAFLSRDHVDVFRITFKESSTGLGLALTPKLQQDLPKRSEFVATALSDRFVVAISRSQVRIQPPPRRLTRVNFVKLQIYDFSMPSQPSGTIDFDYQPERVLRLTSVAMSSSTTANPLIALGLTLQDMHPRIHLYEFTHDHGHLTSHRLRTLEFGAAVPQPHGEPHALSFARDGTHLISGSTLRGDLLTWNLASESPFPSYRAVVPVNDGQGHGIAGITSAVLFPSSRFILATTGASSQPAVIKARSASNRKPGTLNIFEPRAPMRSCAVATRENAFALMTRGGRVFVSRLHGLGAQPGYSASAPEEVLEDKDAFQGDVEFGLLPGSGRQVLVAALVTKSLWKYRGEVVALAF